MDTIWAQSFKNITFVIFVVLLMSWMVNVSFFNVLSTFRSQITQSSPRQNKQRCMAGSSKFYSKHLPLLLADILTVVKEKLCCTTMYSKSGVNQIWILKNSKDLFEFTKSYQIQWHQNIRFTNGLYNQYPWQIKM